MRAHIAGGGFGGLAAAALSPSGNAGVLGADITIYEADERPGGGFFLGGSVTPFVGRKSRHRPDVSARR